MSNQDRPFSDLDRAVADRLAQLGRSPVDTSRLQRRLGAALQGVSVEERTPVLWVLRSWRNVASIAAVLAVCVTLAVITVTSRSSMQQYSATEVVAAHEKFLNSAVHLVTVANVLEANCRCSELWENAPAIPELAGAQIRCCCVEDFARCRAACLHFEYDGAPVTMAVTRDAQLDAPGATVIHQEGRQYTVGTLGRYEILDVSRRGRSICLVSELPRDRLLQLAAGIDL
jgi:hypothetical protein